MIAEYLVHTMVHLTIELVASGSLVHKTIELPVFAKRILVFDSVCSPPSFAVL